MDYAQGRDIPPGYTGKIVETLQAWVNSCDSVSNCIDMQIKYANGEKAKRLYNKERIEQEVSELNSLIIGHSVLNQLQPPFEQLINLKKVLKSQASDSDESMQVDTHGPGTSGSSGMNQSEVRKKPSKMKNPRSSAGECEKLKYICYMCVY